MDLSTASMVNESLIQRGLDLPSEFLRLPWLKIICRALLLLVPLVFMLGAIQAQSVTQGVTDAESSETPYVVDGVTDTMAYAVGQSLRINGTVKNGAISLGGDVIVQGTVEGDVAAIGGSVIQLEGSRIGGDVMVVGGAYRHLDKTPNRSPAGMTIMYAGYEQQLRSIMRNPKDLLAPHWSAGYVGFRLLAVLFWFIVSLALTAAMPGTISRGIARLQLSSLRVGVIGFLGALIIGVGVPFSLHFLPSPLSVLVGLLALLLILVAGLFGRVIIYAATGRWLQRKFLRVGKNSESVALLVGTAFWTMLSSLPYIWPFVVAVVLVTSLGLALTARYRVGWRHQEV
jgi:hypothetical protein